MKGRYRIIFDLTAIVLLSLVLAVFVWLSSDGHIYFSRDSGYYDDAFTLEIRGGRGFLRKEIYYTLDGSEPTEEDYLYNEDSPVYIGDGRDGDMDRCNVVRASVFDGEGNCLDSITGLYFVGFQIKSGYEGLYMASIVTDPDNLFDSEKGIYAEGPGETANYFGRGPEWEREAALTVFDLQQRQILTQKCGIRIKGGTSRSYAQKSIRCYARDEYCGDNKFHAELFQKGRLPHRIVFYAGGNDYFCKVRDPMIHELTEELNFATMDFLPCVLFLNNEYWGVYYISEEYDDAYISDHYDVEKDDVILIKAGYLKEGEDADYEDYLATRQFMIKEDMSLSENYAEACRVMDMDSYIDYYAMQIYIQRHSDWPSSNYALWKTREDEGSRFGDGRWRWMLFDVNSPGMDAIEYDSLSEVLHDDEMFYSLYQNEEFRRQFAERILYIGRELLNAENCGRFLAEYEAVMKTPLLQSGRRFYPEVGAEDFDKEIQWLTTFFADRYDAVWAFLESNMGGEWLFQNGIYK